MEHSARTIEEKIAHLERVVEDLSDVLSRQQEALDRLGRGFERLLVREAAREADQGGPGPNPNQRPPHW